MGKCKHCGNDAGFIYEVCKECNEKIYINKITTDENLKCKDKIVIRKYEGNQNSAFSKFEKDAERMSSWGYAPISQSWAPGSYGCGSFLLALLLCLIIVGFIVFIYMLIVKPDGVLTVTYELKNHKISESSEPVEAGEKLCPQCAETIKSAAKICRYCGHSFEEVVS